MSAPSPPDHLAPATAEWWTAILDEFELDDHHVLLLTGAAEAWDRCQQAREALVESGPVYMDRFGQPKARPEVAIERDSRIAFARLLRELALDGAPDPKEKP